MGLQLGKINSGNLCARKLLLRRNVIMSVSVVFILAGCSSLPDSVNPVNWYESAKNAIWGDDKVEEVEAKSGETNKTLATGVKSGSNKPFPSLSSVPERPKNSNGDNRKKIARGLVSGRQDVRQYSGEVISR